MCIGIINLFLCASVYIFVKFAIIISNISKFKNTRESDIEKDECEHDEDISKSKGKVTHVPIFFMHDKNCLLLLL